MSRYSTRSLCTTGNGYRRYEMLRPLAAVMEVGYAEAMRIRSFWLLLALTAILSIPSPAQELTGVIDIHAHADPDGLARSINAIDLAKLAAERGMRGLVVKNHYESTASVAYLMREVAPGLEVFGGIALNRPVGGINASAVEWMTQVEGGYGRIVWMPTYDSEHHVTGRNEDRPFVSISRNEELLPEVKEVISLIAASGLVLATGHSAPEESILLIEEARRQGVEQIVVTHPMQVFVRMPLEIMQRAAQLGAFLEFVRVAPGSPAIQQTVEAIRAVGVEHCILSSDLGQANNPLHPDGLAAFFSALEDAGLTREEIEIMSERNPAILLGLQ